MSEAPVSMVGLMCHPAVKWLIFTNKAINEYIMSFIAGAAPSDTFKVAGPPSIEHAKRLRDDPDANVELPTVLLTLKMEEQLDRKFVRVVASDDDVASVQAWMMRAKYGPINTDIAEPPRPMWH